MLHIYRSDSANRLFDALLPVLRPVEGPFDHPLLTAPGRLSAWLRRQLAARLGVWMGPIDAPRSAIDAILFPADGKADSFTADAMTFAIYDLLPDLVGEGRHEHLNRFFQGDHRPSRAFAFARTMADLFNEYLMYRPQLMNDWQKTDGDWQTTLFARMSERLGGDHLAARATAFLSDARKGAVRKYPIPRRMVVFGVSSLPPLQLEVLATLSLFAEVHLFAVVPGSGYFCDAARRSNGADHHSLFAALCAQPAAFQELLLDASSRVPSAETDLFTPAGTPGRLLDTLCDDLRGDRMAQPEHRLAAAPDDRSIVHHVCHSPLREVEAVWNEVVDVLSSGIATPDDIVVMAPDMGTYGPFVEAVFGVAHGDVPSIPCTVEDAAGTELPSLCDALVRMLSLTGTPVTLVEVCDLLALLPVREHQGLTEDEVSGLLLRGQACGIRAGIDEARRAELGLPVYGEHTFAFGLGRMMLGLAMDKEDELFCGVSPFAAGDAAEGIRTARFAAFCRTLFSWLRDFEKPRPMAAWQADLPKALALVADTGVDGGAQHRVIERALGDLSAAAAGARCDRPLDAATVKELLERRLSGPVWHRSTPGGVTFCSMRHLRGVPCRVVILMGMNEGAFPLSRAIPSFHPAHRQPLPGDRDDRADGQHMFLEALLAAQERFVITRTGIADGGGELPPAAPVSDLLEALERRFLPSKNFAGVGDQVTVRHPMKPFSRRCFDGSDPRLFSYDADNLIAPSPVASPSVVLSEPDASGDSPTTPIDVSLSDLHAFWKDPVAFYVARHLHVKLPNIEAPVDCTDFVEADFLQRWRLGDEVTQARFRGDDRRVRKEVLRAKAAIPPGVPGELLLADVDAVASPIAAEGRRLAGGLAPENLEVSVPLVVDGRRVVVTGLLSPVVNGLALDCRYDKLQSSGLLRSWLKALVLCAAMPEAEGAARIGRDDRGSRVVRFRRPDDPVPLLASMVRLYLVGSHQPLPFVPDTAFKLATAWQDGDTGKEPWILEDARRQFEGPALEQSEIMRRAFLDGHAFDDPRNGFVAITREVVSPLLHHEEGEILP